MWKKLFKLLKNVLLAVVFSVYLAFGAVVFHYLEKEAESKIKAETERHRLDILNNYTCLPHDALEHLIKIVTVAVKQGLNPLENSTTSKHTNWDISSAFFFSGTVVTTIGYGTIAPQTAGGQIFCVGYALFGIPLNIFVLSRVGKHLSHYCKGLEKRLVKKGMKKKTAKILTMIFFLVLGIFVFLGIPPLVFGSTECWSYEEGLYYAFISLSTIGFGDYVVGSGQRCDHPFKGYRVLVCFWIFFGLAWLSLLINLLTSFLDYIEKKITKRGKRREEIGLQEVTRKPEAHHEKSVI